MAYKESTNNKQTCSFCQRSRRDVAKLVVSQDVSICNICIDMVHDLLHKEGDAELKPKSKSVKIPEPTVLKEMLDFVVIGQDQAKIALSVAVHNHYKRILKKTKTQVDKSNVLLLGGTGTGKTLLARTIAELLDVPFVIGDATTLTQSGYVGDDAESLLSRLLQAADDDVERAEHGIIFIDEIDKLASKVESNNSGRDISGEGVQQALLKMLEGSDVRVPVESTRRLMSSDTEVIINTTNILFICSGAFVGLEKIMQRSKGSNIGFSGKVEKTVGAFNLVKPQDIIKYGLIPELVGRLPVLTHTNPLSKADLIRVLTEPTNSLLSQYQCLFDPVKLNFTEDALDLLVSQAIADSTGARGLRGQLDKILTPLQFRISSEKTGTVSSVLVNKNVVTGTGEPLITFKKIAPRVKNEQKT